MITLRKRAHRGAITIETLLVLFPFLLVVLVTLQFLLLAFAQQIFNHALYRAARASSVLLFEPPKYFDNAPLGQTKAKTPRHAAVVDASETILSILPSPWLSKPLLNALRKPSLLETGITMAGSRSAYLALSFHDSKHSKKPLVQVSATSTPYLRLSYLHRCRVPLAKALICRSKHASSTRKKKGEKDSLFDRSQKILRNPSSFMVAGDYFRFHAQVPVVFTPGRYLK